MTEKIEDLVTVVFLPLFFALSGLNTDLSLLNDGKAWGYVVGVTAIAFVGKIVGGTLAARLCKLVWRESFTIGVLMSCKGLVELIVLVRLTCPSEIYWWDLLTGDARTLVYRLVSLPCRPSPYSSSWLWYVATLPVIISCLQTIPLLIMTQVTTVATTPLTKLLFPPSYQQKLEKWKRGEIEWDGTPTTHGSASTLEKLTDFDVKRLLVQIRVDSLPGIFTLIALLGSKDTSDRTSVPKAAEAAGEGSDEHAFIRRKKHLEVHGLRILELTERTSSVMQVTEEENAQRDPIVSAFTTFTQLQSYAVSGSLVVVPTSSYADTFVSHASDLSSDLAIIPWGEYGSISEDLSAPMEIPLSERFSNRAHLEFIEKSFDQATCNTGVFINQGLGAPRPRPRLARTISNISFRSVRDRETMQPVLDKTHHIYLPFFGGADDRTALRLVLQMASNPDVTVTIAHFTISDAAMVDASGAQGTANDAGIPDLGTPDITSRDGALLATIESSLPQDLKDRVTVIHQTVTKAEAMSTAEAVAKKYVGKSPKNAGDIVVLGRRHTLFDSAGASYQIDLRRTVGTTAEKVVNSDLKASVFVIQAAGRGLEA